MTKSVLKEAMDYFKAAYPFGSQTNPVPLVVSGLPDFIQTQNLKTKQKKASLLKREAFLLEEKNSIFLN